MTTKIIRNRILCACGCGQFLIDRDHKGNVRRFIHNHHGSTDKSRRLASQRIARKGKPRSAWNKGKSYVCGCKTEYANRGSWTQALRRIFPDQCMRCGWKEATCDAHHISHKGKGGKHTLKNGVILCPNCHRLAHCGLISKKKLREIRMLAIMANSAPPPQPPQAPDS